MQKNILIVGVDPGTTAAYALLDLDENVVKISSSKELNLSLMISEITDQGLSILVGTDKKNAPSFVAAFATKVGAKIVSPEEDLLVDEKKKIIHERNKDSFGANDHERDALASALFAYKKVRQLIVKIKYYLSEIKKDYLFEEVCKLVILQDGLPIKVAVDIILKPNDEDLILIKKEIETNKLSQNEIKLYERKKLFETENQQLRDYVKKLQRENQEQKKEFNYMLSKIKQQLIDKKQEMQLQQKENSIIHKENLLKQKDEAINKLMKEKAEESQRLLSFIKTANNYTIVKKLRDLNRDYELKRSQLALQEKDILFVEDGSIYSESNYKEINNKVKIIITRNPNKLMKEFFLVISPDEFDRLSLQDLGEFMLAEKESLDKKINKKELLMKVIGEYKQLRKG
ncbi:DUF460 domain-containing protein [Candidatus Woesearchaeota archaeon]|nr:DUF460 domain-containing protein [Candidatus Woesearchaeota archaeon]